MDLSSFGVDTKKPKSVDDKNLNIDFESLKDTYKTEEVEIYLPWFLKYQIKNFNDLIITKDIEKIIKFMEEFKPGKALLLCGQAGSGKTTTLTLLGNYYDYEVYELNASDKRNKKAIDEAVGTAIKQNSLFAQKKLILIDEVDGVSGTDDRGGVSELAKFIKTSRYPIVFTANDPESDKIKALKKACLYINFENHSRELLLGIAKRIFENEGISYDEDELLEFIEERNTVDIRGFINDLQTSVYDGKFFKNEDLEIRDYKKLIENLLDKVYFSYPEDSYFSSFNTDINLDDLFLYLEENTPDTYSKAALVNAYNEISKADVFRGRIRKWQHWRFLVYVSFYLTFGVSSVKDSPIKVKSYKRNNRILKKWIYGNKVNALNPRTKVQKNAGDEEKFIERLANVYKTSAKRCRSRDLLFFSIIYRNDDEFRSSMDEKLSIDDSVKKSLLEI